MAKNIAIFVMSTFSNKSAIEYGDKSGNFYEMCEHTNEAALKYMVWKLKEEKQKLDGAYAFITDEADKDLERFKNLFIGYDFPIEKVPLYNNGDLQGSFKSVCDMFDILRTYINKNIKNKEKVTIHIDMTGGPRHAVMLMLALIQMIKFSGADIGMVTYANILRKNQPSDVTKGMIEDTGDIMDMFTLISGAEEFNAFGNVSQIQKYFAPKKDISWCLNSLLKSMGDLSESIRICSNYDSMEEALNRLNDSINMYENFFRTNKNNLIEQEIFFSKLLPTIKAEYADIMPKNGESPTPLQIIKWCAKKGFLQQVLAFYTEWIPNYLVEEDLITVNESIKKDCIDNRSKLNQTTWENYLFRIYEPEDKAFMAEKDVNLNLLTYDDLKSMRQYPTNTLLEKMLQQNGDIAYFIKRSNEFAKKVKIKNFIQKVEKLPKENIIYKVLKESAPKNIAFKTYLENNISKYSEVDKIIMNAFFDLDKKSAKSLFNLVEKANAFSEDFDTKSKKRAKVFRYLLNKNLLKTKIPANKLLRFVAEYVQYVSELRNKFSHADSEGSDKESNANITKAIIDSVNLLELK